MIAQNAPSSTFPLHSFIDPVAPAPTPLLNPAPFATINRRETDALNGCTGVQIRVYLAIAGHANPQGTCWPGRERIAALAGIRPEHVSRATAALERKGLLIKETLPNGKIVYGLPLHSIPRAAQPAPRPAFPSCHQRHPEQTIEHTKEQREPPHIPVAEPTPVESEPTPLSVPKVRIQSRTTLDANWTLPKDWLHEAQRQRPDLSPDVIQISGQNFLDYHRSRNTQSADWLSEWRRWIRREQPGRTGPLHAPPSPQRIAAYHQPYQPAEPTEAEKQAERDAWRARMLKLGIEPDTGERLQPATTQRPVTPPVAGHLAALRAALHAPCSPDQTGSRSVR